jgi:hypothetical protein
MPNYIFFVEDTDENELGVFATWLGANKFRRENRSIYGDNMLIKPVIGELR